MYFCILRGVSSCTSFPINGIGESKVKYVVWLGIGKLLYRSVVLIFIPTSNVWEHLFSPQPHQQNVLLFFLFLFHFILLEMTDFKKYSVFFSVTQICCG